jgi:hypothetical protein
MTGWITDERSTPDAEVPAAIAPWDLDFVEPPGWYDDIDDGLLYDFRQFRSSGVTAAVLTAGLRMIAFLGLAKYQDVKVGFRYFADLIPYPVVLADRQHFAKLVSQSTLAATAAMLAVFVIVSIKHMKRDQTVIGWFMSIVCSAEMLLVDLIRHILTPPVVVTKTVLWTLWPLALGCIVLALVKKDTDGVKAPTSTGQESSELPLGA